MRTSISCVRARTALLASIITLAGIGCADRALAQSFTDGDLYLIDDALPVPGGRSTSYVPGIMRIKPSTGEKFYVLTGGIVNTPLATYDPFRDRVIAYSSAAGLLAVDSIGNTTPLPAVTGIPGQLAPTGDGRVFLARNSDPILYLTVGNVWKTLFANNGTTPFVLPAGFQCHSAIFDVTTNSLIVARDGASGLNEFVSVHLSADGTHTVGSVTIATQALIDGGAAVGGISSAPNGQIMLSLDDNTGGAQVRWWTLDPNTLACTYYADTNYFGAAAQTSGTWSDALNFAVCVNTFSDNLLAFGPGIPEAGSVVATGVSSAFGSGESCRLVSIGNTVNGAPSNPADLNHDGHVNAADLAIMLGAWGPCVGCIADLNGDGIVGATDLGVLLGSWG